MKTLYCTYTVNPIRVINVGCNSIRIKEVAINDEDIIKAGLNKR